MHYTIGEMAKLLHIQPSTLRFYDKEGLLPFVERTGSGIRVFTETDYEWLRVIECLKSAGMPLKDIKNFIELAIAGDSTIAERLTLIQKQRRAVEEQIAKMQDTLAILQYKEWYYETATHAGSTAIPRNMAENEIPPQFVEVRKQLKELHYGK